jgi:hypothetical protein
VSSRRVGGPALAAVAALALIVAGPMQSVLARLSNITSAAGNTVTAGRIFSAARTATAWTVNDASSGSASVQNDVLSYAGDARTKTTGAWAATFATTRYFELTFQPVLAAGVAISGATFNLDFVRGGANGTVCFYFDVRTASSSTVLATYGSAGTPVACNATAALSSVSTPIPIVTTTASANDLAVRVYMTNSGTTKTVIIDRTTVSGTTPYQSFTLYEKQYVDASTGTAATTAWAFSTNDATTYTSASNWPVSFASTKFLSFTFPAYLPAGATVSAASMTRMYHTVGASDTICWYMEVFNGASLIGTHGSTGTPISCSSSNSIFVTDTVPLAEVNSAAIANNTVVKLYNKSSGTNKSVDTLILLSVTWSMP